VNRAPDPCSPEAFERRYRRHPDPWRFASSPYERHRYDVTLAALGRERYGKAIEPGCSVGELTARLALRCDWLLAADVSPTAAARARARCAGLANVVVRCADVEAELPDLDFDLVVFSELGYYFSGPRLSAVAQRLAGRLRSGGEFIAVHWLGHSADHVLHGSDVHRVLRETLTLTPARAQRHDGFLIDSWVRP
jgi:trans-aconitate methyltransferase